MEATFQDFPLLGVEEPDDQIVNVAKDKDENYEYDINQPPGDVYDATEEDYDVQSTEDYIDVTEDEDDVYDAKKSIIKVPVEDGVETNDDNLTGQFIANF